MSNQSFVLEGAAGAAWAVDAFVAVVFLGLPVGFAYDQACVPVAVTHAWAERSPSIRSGSREASIFPIEDNS